MQLFVAALEVSVRVHMLCECIQQFGQLPITNIPGTNICLARSWMYTFCANLYVLLNSDCLAFLHFIVLADAIPGTCLSFIRGP